MRQKGQKIQVKKKIAENFLNLGKETKIQIQEAQSIPTKIKLIRRSTPRNIILKITKKSEKKKTLKAARENGYIQGKFHKVITDFTAETVQARREWHCIFKVLKDKNLQPKILYPVRLSFRIQKKRQISSQTKFKGIFTTTLAYTRIVKGDSLGRKERT